MSAYATSTHAHPKSLSELAVRTAELHNQRGYNLECVLQPPHSNTSHVGSPHYQQAYPAADDVESPYRGLPSESEVIHYIKRNVGLFTMAALLFVVVVVTLVAVSMSGSTMFNSSSTRTHRAPPGAYAAPRRRDPPPDSYDEEPYEPLPPDRIDRGADSAPGRTHAQATHGRDLHYVFYYKTGVQVLESSPFTPLSGDKQHPARVFDLPFTHRELDTREIAGYSLCCHTANLAICNSMRQLVGYEMEMLLSYEERRVKTPGWKLYLYVGNKFEDPECHFIVQKDEKDHNDEYAQAAVR